MHAFLEACRRTATTTLAFGAFAVVAGSAQAQAWTHYGYNAAHTFYNPAETQLNPGNVKQLQQLWGKKIGSERTATLGAPLYHDGTLVVCSTYDGIVAVEARTGRKLAGSTIEIGAHCYFPSLYGTTLITTSFLPDTEQIGAYGKAGTKWTVPGDGSLNEAAVYGNQVFVSNRQDDVYAYNASTGAQTWRAQTAFYSTSVSADIGKVVLLSIPPSSGPGTLYALDATTGGTAWTAAIDAALTFRPPLISAGKIITETSGGWVNAHDLQTGAVLWKTQIKPGSVPSFATDGETVFVSDSGGIAALNIQTGALLWTGGTRSTERISSQAVLANGVLYYTALADSSSLRQYLVATEAATGKVKARFDADSLQGTTADLIVVDGLVQIASRNGRGYIYVYGLR